MLFLISAKITILSANMTILFDYLLLSLQNFPPNGSLNGILPAKEPHGRPTQCMRQHTPAGANGVQAIVPHGASSVLITATVCAYIYIMCIY
jgi:hypothetical protein